MHSFILSVESSKCAKCKRAEIDHTEHATCESCDYVGSCELYSSRPDQLILLCPSCIQKEEKVRTSPEQAQIRVNQVIEKSKQVDSNIQIKSDLFNAQTVSINELRNAINSDEAITDKHFELAKILTDRLNHFKKVIFELNEEMVSRASEQRAVQTYLNDLSNKLRAEQREQIKLSDINYKPNPVKVVKPRNTSPTKKFDKTEVRKQSILLNTWLIENKQTTVPESVIQMICIARNLSPEQAVNELKSNWILK